MIELERLLAPNLSKIKLWGRYIDDSICFAKFGLIEYIISVLNSSHRKIKFTYEVGGNAKLAFLDVLLCEMMKILQQQYIEKRVFQMLI